MAEQRESSERETVTEVEFRTEDPTYPLVSITGRTERRARLEQIVPRKDNAYAEYFSVTGVEPERAISVAREYDGLEVSLLHADGDEGLFEIFVSEGENYFVLALTEVGAIPRRMTGVDGVARVTAEIPVGVSTRSIVEHFRSVHPTVEVVARRQTDYAVPLFTAREFEDAISALLTARQREVLMTAYDAGYFEWPRGADGEELAAELGVSPPTFFEHLRIAQQDRLGPPDGNGVSLRGTIGTSGASRRPDPATRRLGFARRACSRTPMRCGRRAGTGVNAH
jgi:hypothetical protein